MAGELKSLANYIKEKEKKNFEVVRIEGGKELKQHLIELGIQEGATLSLQETIKHEHTGPLAIEVEGKEIAVAQGIAKRIIMDVNGTEKLLLEMEANDTGKIKKLEDFKDVGYNLENLGIKEGASIKVIGHLAHQSYKVKQENKEIELCPGEAAKILVEKDGKTLQLIYLKPGDKAIIVGLIEGFNLETRFKDMGIKLGKEIMLSAVEHLGDIPPKHMGDVYSINVNNKYPATIGSGIAEKIIVRPI